MAKGAKTFDEAIPPPQPRIVLVDRPQSPQSLILAGTILSVEGTDELATLLAANDVLGGSFLSRLNYDLRETKGWAYGVQGIVNRVEHRVPYTVYAPVQAETTGPPIAATQEMMKALRTSKALTADERSRTI